MKPSIIYKVEISYVQTLLRVKSSEAVVTYFSNLKRTIEALQASLLINGWGVEKVNYTAVYRSLKSRDKFVAEFYLKGVKFFKIHISTQVLNPSLTTLGIEPKPN
jgi:hypothetical protein